MPSKDLKFFLPGNNANLSHGCVVVIVVVVVIVDVAVVVIVVVFLFELDETISFLLERQPFLNWTNKICPIYYLMSLA